MNEDKETCSCDGDCEFKQGDTQFCHFNCGKALDEMDHEDTCARCQ